MSATLAADARDMRDVRLQAPFPWFGGKSRVAPHVWPRFGMVRNYIEPFFGSGAMLLGRPLPQCGGIETVNDLDGFVANFWRSVQHAPDEVAQWADAPVFENDLHARHAWLVEQRDSLRHRLEGDPCWHDAQIAGWWVWGMCAWIGGGFCSGRGPWSVRDGQLVQTGSGKIQRQLPHLGNAGQGINRQRPHLSGGEQGVDCDKPVQAWLRDLSDRLRRVRVCSGDWSRICGPSVTTHRGMTAVFLDPPYADTANRGADLYARDSTTVAHDVRAWAIANGDNPLLRIALCGYEGEHEMPSSWDVMAWDAAQGYGGAVNGARERIWFSPACLAAQQPGLF